MRKMLVIFAMVMLVMPTAFSEASDQTQLNQLTMDMWKVKDALTTIQTAITNINETIQAQIGQSSDDMKKFISGETDPIRQSLPSILLVSLVTSFYLMARGMDILHRKIRKKKEVY